MVKRYAPRFSGPALSKPAGWKSAASGGSAVVGGAPPARKPETIARTDPDWVKPHSAAQHWVKRPARAGAPAAAEPAPQDRAAERLRRFHRARQAQRQAAEADRRARADKQARIEELLDRISIDKLPRLSAAEYAAVLMELVRLDPNFSAYVGDDDDDDAPRDDGTDAPWDDSTDAVPEDAPREARVESLAEMAAAETSEEQHLTRRYGSARAHATHDAYGHDDTEVRAKLRFPDRGLGYRFQIRRLKLRDSTKKKRFEVGPCQGDERGDKGGRPPKRGYAMSGAERARDYRQRKRERGKTDDEK
jgi:hypothetical protein